MNAHKVSYDKLTSNLTCPLAVTKRSYNYFMSCHYVVITVYLSYQHNKINLYGPIDLLHFDNTKIFARIMFGICLFVTTLALGSWPKQGLTKARAKKETWESHFMLLGVQKNVREWTLTLPSELPLWELESRWTPNFLRSNCRGQNPLDWRVIYIIKRFWNIDI
jgi:hypothetical protein